MSFFDHKKMSLKERVQNYNISFPNRPDLMYDKNFIMGCWLIGSQYGNQTGYYGSYPYGLQERMDKLFPDAERTLELFGGKVKPDPPRLITFDIKPENNPSICDNVLNLEEYVDIISKVDVVRADPPYEDSDFEKYNCEPFNKTEVIRKLGRTMKSGSYLLWLDLRYPMWSKEYWKLIGTIAVYVGTNTRVRSWFLWEHI